MKKTFLLAVALVAGFGAAHAQSTPATTTTPAGSTTVQPQVGQGTTQGNYGQPATGGVPNTGSTTPQTTAPTGATIETQVGTGTREGNFGQPDPNSRPADATAKGSKSKMKAGKAARKTKTKDN